MNTAPEITRPYLTLRQLAERWQVSETTIRREVRRGRLRQKLIGGQCRFESSEVERYEKTA